MEVQWGPPGHPVNTSENPGGHQEHRAKTACHLSAGKAFRHFCVGCCVRSERPAEGDVGTLGEGRKLLKR